MKESDRERERGRERARERAHKREGERERGREREGEREGERERPDVGLVRNTHGVSGHVPDRPRHRQPLKKGRQCQRPHEKGPIMSVP